MPPDQPSVTAERVLSGRYRLVRPIARGGMAEVWEGYDDVLTRPVAIKVLHAHLAADAGFVTRFRREAVAAARLSHPGIVATFDTGTDAGVVFIVMELVRGRTLRQSLEEAGQLPLDAAVTITAAVADALHCAHQAGLVHRDVKPANILLPNDDATSGPLVAAKVADFGIAKLQAEAEVAALTQTGAIVGSARYLSPEQVQGENLDARTDEYALGVVLYEMLCGRPPFVASTDLATALEHLHGHAPAPHELRPDIPPSLEAVVVRAMARRPDDRFPSLAAFREALAGLDLGPGRGGHDGATTPPRATAAIGRAWTDEPGVDDAVPSVVREPTPPAGTPPAVREARRRFAPMVAAALAVTAALLVVAVALQRGGSPGGRAPAPAGEGAAVTVAEVSSFDPAGPDGEENEQRASLAHDGDPLTSWASHRYSSRAFGGLKPGVGLVVRLAAAVEVDQVVVRSPVRGWSAVVYVADAPSNDLAGWGPPVANRTNIDGDATFDLGRRRGAAVLLWITDPGSDRRAEVSEIDVTA